MPSYYLTKIRYTRPAEGEDNMKTTTVCEQILINAVRLFARVKSYKIGLNAVIRLTIRLGS